MSATARYARLMSFTFGATLGAFGAHYFNDSLALGFALAWLCVIVLIVGSVAVATEKNR